MSMVESRELRVEGKNHVFALRAVFDTQPSTLNRRPRLGVTLIELLVVILIIGLLAALVLGVAAVAGETAREQHSKHVVQRLHTLLMEYYGTFKTRRVRLNPQIEKVIDENTSYSAAEKGRLKAEARLYALRELMVLEVPDRWSDVLLNTVPTSITGFADALKPVYLHPDYLSVHGRTDLSEAYLRRYNQLANPISPAVKPLTEVLTDNQGAECLYMVITMATGEGEARALFSESSILEAPDQFSPLGARFRIADPARCESAR
jgi:prepilin-type N-terminal cleavage/methylation domain-containing protein